MRLAIVALIGLLLLIQVRLLRIGTERAPVKCILPHLIIDRVRSPDMIMKHWVELR